MPFDDDPDERPDDRPGLGPPPPADDRLWRHPSELAGSAPVQIVTRRTPRRRLVALGVACSVAGAAIMLAGLVGTGSLDRKRTTVAVETVNQPLPAPDSQVAQVTAQVLPGLARVDAVSATGTLSATAVVFRSDGYLLTTADAVSGATSFTAQLADGTTLPAKLVGSDATSDVAVVKVERTAMHAAVLTDEDDIVLGEPAMSVNCIAGRPADPDISVGLVTGLGRRVSDPAGVTLGDMIQTNVHPATANAAAVLVDSSGTVLGLITSNGSKALPAATTTAATDSNGNSLELRYATPIDYASQVADQLIATGRVAHAWLGVRTTDLTSAQQADAGHAGVRVDQVIGASPAQHAGLEAGDVIVAMDGQDIDSSTALTVALRVDKPHQLVRISYLRDGGRHTTQAVLGDQTSGS